jgi:quinoprotein glucose dehydrogenase
LVAATIAGAVVVYKDVLIVGGRVSEGLPASPGDIRAYDARTGALRWSFHTIPHPGESGYETWPADAWTSSGGVDNWAGMAVDETRGVVYVPTGSASADFYGANRLGDDLFANSLIALDAATGRRLWHFQTVHHDIWDRDFPSPPGLVTVTQNGRRVDAVAQTTTHGFVFLFDRATGTPLFPIESSRYPESTVDGEHAAAMQPLPTRPAPFARQRLTEQMLTDRTPQAHHAALESFRTFRSEGPVPLSVGAQTVIFPGFDGGAEWGGSAFDPETGLLHVNAHEMAWTAGLAPSDSSDGGGRQTCRASCASCHRDDMNGTPPQIPSLVDVGQRRSAAELSTIVKEGAGRMPGFPALATDALAALVTFLRTGQSDRAGHDTPAIAMAYRFTGYRKFLDADGYPAIAPPWGTLSAINLKLRQEIPRVRQGDRRAVVGDDVAARGQRDAVDLRDRRPSVHRRAGGGGRSRPGTPAESGGVYVAYALPAR